MSIYNILYIYIYIYTRIQGWHQWCWSGVGTHRQLHPPTDIQSHLRHPPGTHSCRACLSTSWLLQSMSFAPRSSQIQFVTKKIGISWTRGGCKSKIYISHDWHMFRVSWLAYVGIDRSLSSDRSGAGGPGHQEIEIWLVCDPTNRNVGKPMPETYHLGMVYSTQKNGDFGDGLWHWVQIFDYMDVVEAVGRCWKMLEGLPFPPSSTHFERFIMA